MGMQLSKSDKTALVFGPTTMVGKHLLDFLLLNSAYAKVITFSSEPLHIEHPKLTKHLFDFKHLDQNAELIKGNDLFCALGNKGQKSGNQAEFGEVDHTYTYQIARIASKNKVSQLLLVSSVAANPDSAISAFQLKGAIEKAIKALSFWSIHIFRPSVLLGQRPVNRFGEEVAGRIGRFLDRLTGGVLTKYKPVEADIVAKAMVKAAQSLEKGTFVYPSHWLQKMAEEEDKRVR